MLAAHQVGPERGDPGPITRRCAGLGRERRSAAVTATTRACLDPVLGHPQLDRGEVEDLPDLLTHDGGFSEVATTALAGTGGVDHDLVRLRAWLQPGTTLTGLQPRPEPDEIVVHAPGSCEGCGGDLAEATVVGEQVRQVFDLPPIQLRVTEHRVQTRACSCGHRSAASFPTQASAPTCYGPGVAALGTYLMGRQHLPVARTAELMSEVLGAPVSTGWLSSLLPTAAGQLAGFMAAVRARVQRAPVVHFDETGGRVAGKLW